MHCWVVAPQRSFCTRYLPPPTVLDPNGSQICAAAGAGAATVVAGAFGVVVVGAFAAAAAVVTGMIGFVAAIPTAFPTSTVPRVTARARPAASR